MDYKDILALIRDFEKTTLTSLELEIDSVKVKMTKQSSQNIVETTLLKNEIHPQKEVTLNKNYTVKSPLVGTFYSSSNPANEPFVQVGSFVKKGDPLCIIEAMKIMNEITSPQSGKIISVTAKNGDAIGFDQVLFMIENAK